MRIFGNNGAIVKQEILKLLPKEYHESGNIASSKKASDLLPSRECDNRIELEAAQEELHHGRGFKVLRGLPVNKHTHEENFIIYAGISSHMAPVRGRQDFKYEGEPADVRLNHIKDLSNTSEKDKQVFHTDAGDIVAPPPRADGVDWPAAGECITSWHPRDRILSAPYMQGAGRLMGERMLIRKPSVSISHQALALSPARNWLNTGEGFDPAEALDALHFLAEKFNVGLDFRKGDIQYVNNLSIFHAHDSYKDTEEQQRHLVRLWLRDPENAWETPAPLRPR
ncbi:hypothetical protein V8E54_005683 [Elaphomyces granulatus]